MLCKTLKAMLLIQIYCMPPNSYHIYDQSQLIRLLHSRLEQCGADAATVVRRSRAEIVELYVFLAR